MWVVWLLSLFAFGQTQILTATGAVSWENSGNWDLGSIPLGLLAVVINTSAQVTFDTMLTTALPSLTLGSASAVDTAIIITGQRDLLVTNFEWIRGDIRMNNTGVFILNGAAHVSSGANSSIVGGEFRIPLISAGSVSIDASTKLECKGCKLNSHGKMWTLGTNAILNFTGSAELTSDIVFAGTGAWHVEAGATLAVATGVAVTVGNGVNGSISGLLQLASSSSSNIVVASSGWLSLNGGGSVSGGTIDVDGQLTIPSGTAAFTVTTASVTVAGSGNVSVSGRLDVDAALTVSENAHLWVKSGGDFRIKGGVAVTLKNASFDANSDWHLNFPDNNATFAKVTVSGALQLGGRVHLYVSVKPTARVVLVTAASISGSITADVTVGAGAGRRLLGNGQVLVTNTTIEYDPEGGSEASAATSMYCLSGLATTMLFAMI